MIDLLRYIFMTVTFVIIGYLMYQMYNDNK
jgi:preprotein translocase subunit Sec63